MRAGYDAYDVADCYGAMLDAAPKVPRLWAFANFCWMKEQSHD